MRDQSIIMCTTKTTQITTQIPHDTTHKGYYHTDDLKVKMSNFPPQTSHINDEELYYS
jgi:hypothetical protein